MISLRKNIGKNSMKRNIAVKFAVLAASFPVSIRRKFRGCDVDTTDTKNSKGSWALACGHEGIHHRDGAASEPIAASRIDLLADN